eukprot:7503157-Prorocentrum_lima.AAC.1
MTSSLRGLGDVYKRQRMMKLSGSTKHGRRDNKVCDDFVGIYQGAPTVSYTHLTLPTICSV